MSSTYHACKTLKLYDINYRLCPGVLVVILSAGMPLLVVLDF